MQHFARLLVAGLAFIGLCGAVTPPWTRIYTPVIVVIAVVEDGKAEQVYHKIVDWTRQTSAVDMSDPMTAYAIREFGNEAKNRYEIGYGYIDNLGRKPSRLCRKLQSYMQVLVKS